VSVYVIKNFISQEHIEQIINKLDIFDSEHDVQSTRKIMRFGIDKFNGSQASLKIMGDFGQMVRQYGDKAAKLAKILFDYDKEIYLSTLWLSKQIAGSKIKPHKDTDGGMNMQYCHSGVVYLNTQQSGGEIYFPKLDIEIKPEAGDLVLFECRSNESLHGVKLVEQNRYAIPIWLTDDPNYLMD
jgi:hypothetical protein